MHKNNWKIRLLKWYCTKIVHVPFIVDFTPEWMDEMYAIGFAWSEQAANRMRGDEMLLEQLHEAQSKANALAGSRKGRRIANRAAQKAAKKVLKTGRQPNERLDNEG